MHDCPFCDIIQNNSEQIIRDYATVFVVLSDPLLVPGHLLIISKKHVEKFSELSAVERDELFTVTTAMQDLILKTVASGCDITQHYRPFMKQSRLKVRHLHIHLRPREFQDELYENVQKFETDMFTDLTPEVFEKCYQIYKS